MTFTLEIMTFGLKFMKNPNVKIRLIPSRVEMMTNSTLMTLDSRNYDFKSHNFDLFSEL